MDPLQAPGQTPLAVYRNLELGIALLHPDWWRAYEYPNGRLFTPGDLETFIAIDAVTLSESVSARDIRAIERGFLAGLAAEGETTIVSHGQIVYGAVVGLEARQNIGPRVRWIRLLFLDRTQVRLIAQGASADEFDYWLPVFNPAMTSNVFDVDALPTESY